MNIAFDAKRVFHNARGLGNYSRDTVRLLTTFYPENNYFLFNPKVNSKMQFSVAGNTREVIPHSALGKLFPSLWRTKGMCKEIKSCNIDLYHGLSQELPWGIERTGAKSVVTMHDAIFMRYPELYSTTYRKIFIKKNIHACKVADRIIAISEQTKQDLIHFFDADERKIDIVYQGCNNIFREPVSQEYKRDIRVKYNLPEQFILYVGAIEKRKNAGMIVEAIHRKNIDIPLVIVGAPTDYTKEVRMLVRKYGLEKQVFFVHNVENADLPPFYALSLLFVYPSIFEGFGIPVLEAICTGTPVITSRGTCFEEVGGPDTIYVNPLDAYELGDSICKVLNDTYLRNNMIDQGLVFSKKFTDEQIAQNLVNVYLKLL